MSGGGKNQTSTTKVTIPPEVLAQYKKATDMASTAAERPWQSYSSDPSAFVAGMTPTQMAGVGNINANAQAAQPWYQGAGGATVAGMGSANLGGLNVDQYMSPYLRNVAQTTSDLLGQQNEQAMSGQLGNAITAGAGWGDRSGIAAANLNRQQAMSSANILSNLLNQGYTQAQGVAQQQQGADLAARQANLARLMQGGMNLGQLGSAAQEAALQGGQAQMAAGQQEQQTEQARLSAMYNQWLQQQAYPFQTAQFFSNIAQGIGANSGSTTSLTQPAGFFSGLARGGRAGKADGGGLGMASMGGHVGVEHAMQGYADGGMPQDYSAMVLQALFGGGDPNAGAYGMAGGLPGGGAGFVPQPNMQSTVLRPAEMPEPTDQTSVKDVVNAAERGADIYNSEGGQRAGSFIKDLLGYDNPMQHASGGRAGYGLGGTPYESSATSSMGGLPSPGGGYVPPPIDNQSSDKLKPAELAPQEQESGLGKIADIAKIATMFFLKDGGVAGPRHGYDVGGAPGYSDWRKRFQDMPLSSGDEELTGPQPKPNAGLLPLDEGRPKDEYIDPNAVLPVSNAAAKTDNPEASKFDIARDTYANRRKIDEARWALQKVIPGWTTNPVASIADAWSGYYGRTSENAANDANTEKARQTLDWINSNRDYFMMNPDEAAALREDPTGYYDRHKTGLGNANAAPAPALAAPPAGGVAPAAAAPTEQRQIPQVFGDAGMSYTPTLPRPGLAAAAEPTAAGAGPGPAFERAGRGAPGLAAASSISPVTQMKGTPVGDRTGLELYQFNAANDEGTNKINFRDPNGGTLAGFHLGQYKSIDPSIRSLGDVQPHHIRDVQAKWWRENGGDAIQAEYGPEFAASYVNLSMLNPNMAKAALAQSGGDKAGFFDIMGQKLANLGQNPKYAPNVKGWLGRVDRNKRFALNEGPTETPAGGQIAATASGEEPRTALAGADISAPATSGVPQIRQAAGEAGSGLGRGIGGIGDLFRKNENVLLPILSGIGAMASSPSRYLGSAILQGMGAGAGSYMKRQGQLADIAQTEALTNRVNINAVRDAIYYDQGTGQTYAILASGGLQPLADYMEKPAGPIAGGAAVDQTVRQMGVPGVTQFVTGNATAPAAGMPVPATPPKPVDTTQIFWSPGMDQTLSEARRSATRSGAPALIEQSNQQFAQIQNAETAALGNVANVNELTNVVNAAIRDGNAGPLNEYVASITGRAKTVARLFGIDPEIFGQADAQAVIMNKLAALNASQLTPEGQEAYAALKMFADLSPYIGQPPEAMAAITAQLMSNQQRALELAPTIREFRSRSINGVITGSEAEFNRITAQRYAAERDQLLGLFKSDNPEIHQMIEEIVIGKMSPDDAAKVLGAATGNPSLVRYFIPGGR